MLEKLEKLKTMTIIYEYSSKKKDGSKNFKTDELHPIGMDIFGNLKQLPKTPSEIEDLSRRNCKLRHPRSTFERIVEVKNK